MPSPTKSRAKFHLRYVNVTSLLWMICKMSICSQEKTVNCYKNCERLYGYLRMLISSCFCHQIIKFFKEIIAFINSDNFAWSSVFEVIGFRKMFSLQKKWFCNDDKLMTWKKALSPHCYFKKNLAHTTHWCQSFESVSWTFFARLQIINYIQITKTTQNFVWVEQFVKCK